MLLVETRVAPSAIHGLGLFAVQTVLRGTPIWKYQPGFDQSFSPAQFAALPALAQRHLQWFAYFSQPNGCWILSGDHACFMNHSATPNTGAAAQNIQPVVTEARRDIAAGEEITCDYFAFDAEASQKLGAKAD